MNISETADIQSTLAHIIGDYIHHAGQMTRSLTSVASDRTVPSYIRDLFNHFCVNHTMPRLTNVHKVQHKMILELQQLLFDRVVEPEHQYKDDGMQRISDSNMRKLFRSAFRYINDQDQEIAMKS